MSQAPLRLVAAFAPLAATPVLSHLINNGTLNFGGGEKDIIVIVPWLAWSALYAVFSIIYWRKKRGLVGSTFLAVGWSAALVVVALYVTERVFIRGDAPSRTEILPP